MTHTLLFHYLWIIGTALEVVAVGLIAWRRQQWGWCSLIAYALADLIADILLKNAGSHYAVRFYTYWTWHFIADAIKLWILLNVLQSFPGASFLQRELRFFIATAGTVLAILCLALASRDGASLTREVLSAIMTYNNAVAIAWGAFLVATLVGVRVFRLAWSLRGGLIALSVCLKVGAAMFVSLLWSHSTAHAFGADLLQSCAAVLTVALWVLAFTLREQEHELSDAARDTIRLLTVRITAH